MFLKKFSCYILIIFQVSASNYYTQRDFENDIKIIRQKINDRDFSDLFNDHKFPQSKSERSYAFKALMKGNELVEGVHQDSLAYLFFAYKHYIAESLISLNLIGHRQYKNIPDHVCKVIHDMIPHEKNLEFQYNLYKNIEDNNHKILNHEPSAWSSIIGGYVKPFLHSFKHKKPVIKLEAISSDDLPQAQLALTNSDISTLRNEELNEKNVQFIEGKKDI